MHMVSKEYHDELQSIVHEQKGAYTLQYNSVVGKDRCHMSQCDLSPGKPH